MRYRILTASSLFALFVLLLVSSVTVAFSAAPIWRSQIVFPEQRQIIAPLSMTIDAQRQRYYVVDSQQGRIISFNNQGEEISVFNASGQLISPVAMCFARPGKMWVVERSTNELLYIDLNSKQVRRFRPKNRHGKALIIDHIATDSQWRLYASDRLSGNIFRFDDNVEISTTFKAGGSGNFVDFKMTNTGLIALDSMQNKVLFFNFNGQLKQQVVLKSDLDFPVSVAMNNLNQIFILDRPQSKVSVFDRQGELLYAFAQKGYRRGQLNYPNHIAFDWNQQLCVVNQGNDRIEIFNH